MVWDWGMWVGPAPFRVIVAAGLSPVPFRLQLSSILLRFSPSHSVSAIWLRVELELELETGILLWCRAASLGAGRTGWAARGCLFVVIR